MIHTLTESECKSNHPNLRTDHFSKDKNDLAQNDKKISPSKCQSVDFESSSSDKINGYLGQEAGCKSQLKETCWKPLVLFIPLRLGLTDINPIYIRGLKVS